MSIRRSASAVVAAAVAAAALACLAPSAAAWAQESTDRGRTKFERTVPYQLDKVVTLDAALGPAKVKSVEFSQPVGGDSLAQRLRGGASDTEMSLRASFEVEQPEAAEWKIQFVLEFLDRQGKLIERVTRSKGFENKATTFRVDHTLLGYAVPFIADVKLRLEAEPD